MTKTTMSSKQIEFLLAHMGHELRLTPATDGDVVLECIDCGEQLHRWEVIEEY